MYDSSPYGFSHAVKSKGTTTIHCAGQTAWNKDSNLVGANDVGIQARQALLDLTTAFAPDQLNPNSY